MPPDSRALTPAHAVLLGLLQGPTELLPVSSSAHTTLLPFLAGWPYAELDPALRRSFEVALHTGAGLALARALPARVAGRTAILDRRRAGLIALACLPPACAGYAFAGVIERRLAGPRAIAVGLAAGALAMALADARAPARRLGEARAADALALGLAQALALIPGVSRNGATLAAARARGFRRRDAHLLSWAVALPVMFGASALTALRLARSRAAAGNGLALLGGGAAAFCSTLASARLLVRGELLGRPLLPFALYRWLLALLVLRRLRGRATTHASPLS